MSQKRFKILKVKMRYNKYWLLNNGILASWCKLQRATEQIIP